MIKFLNKWGIYELEISATLGDHPELKAEIDGTDVTDKLDDHFYYEMIEKAKDIVEESKINVIL